MKVYKVVAYSSLGICLVIAIIFASLPFRYPNSTIAWGPSILLSMPMLALVALLFARLALSLKTYRLLLGIAAALALVATLAGWMAWPILGIFLLALAALSLPLLRGPSKA